MADEARSRELDLTTALGADAGVSAQCLSVYIPNKDKDGKEIGTQRKWVLECRQLLSVINGGATVMPPVEGSWLNDQGIAILENPVIVYSNVKLEPFVANLPKLREFLHRMGRETSQGEVVFEFGDEFFRIRTFDPQ